MRCDSSTLAHCDAVRGEASTPSLEQMGLPALLAELGVNGALCAAAAGALVGRLAQPASERATHRWLLRIPVKSITRSDAKLIGD